MAKKTNGVGRGHNSGSMWLTRSYNFVDKDPEIDKFRTIWQREHLKESELAVISGLSVSTVANMFGGKTKRPMHSTFAKMAGAMGYEYALQREGKKPDYENEIPRAKEQRKAHLEALAKKRSK